MAFEIEHKYLVKNDNFKTLATESFLIRQGYLSKVAERTVRVRIKGNRGYLTVKGKSDGAVRREFEYEIPYEDAKQMLSLCLSPILEKIRYNVEYDGHLWEVDEFLGAREGLVTAEIELLDEKESYTIPSFVGDNVTGNPEYYNSNL